MSFQKALVNYHKTVLYKFCAIWQCKIWYSFMSFDNYRSENQLKKKSS